MSGNTYKVVLHVYDLTRGMARQMSTSLLGRQIEGVWHTGVYVYEKEYFFGGGIQAIHPSYLVNTYGPPVQVLDLGNTEIPPNEFAHYLHEISPRFTASTYNLLTHNCNNFSNEVVQFLLGIGIPQHILDLPNEVLSTPMGAMFRPMIEEMQANMARNVQSHGLPVFDETPSQPTPTISTHVSKPLGSYVKPVVSADASIHLPKILRRIQAHKSFSPSEQAAFDHLSLFSTSNDPSHIDVVGDRAMWWPTIASLLTDSSSIFTALCLLRAVLAVEISVNATSPHAMTEEVFGLVIQRCEENEISSSAHRILYLSVLANGLVAPTTTHLLHSHTLRFLPFVWSTWHSQSVSTSQASIAAAVVFNLCRRVDPSTTDDIAQLTLVGGCAEVLDYYSNSNTSNEAVERLVVALGLLLRQCTATKQLAAEVGLVHVLSRMKTTTQFRGLAEEVLALI